MNSYPAKGWHLARITFEAETPLSCGAGEGQRADNAIARDANGLPYVPGPTLQGLLRAFYQGQDKDNLFGPESGSPNHSAAALAISHAHVHDSNDKVVCFPADTKKDSVLRLLAQDAPIVRDHVRLDHRHGAAEGGKFERAAVPVGTRFSFELLLYGSEDVATKLDSVLSVMQQPDFRIGSSGARGYGRVTVHKACRGFFQPAEFSAFRRLRQTPMHDWPIDIAQQPCALDPQPTCLVVSFTLAPVNPWRSGQDGVARVVDANGKPADLRPLREGKIDWQAGDDGEQGEWLAPEADGREGYILTGSSLRGPLAHRSLYWWNRQNVPLLDDNSSVEDLQKGIENRSCLESLFGKVEADGSLASALLVDDVAVTLAETSQSAMMVSHVKIGRHSGGAFASALYNEDVIETDRLACSLYIRPPRADNQAVAADVRTAFLNALYDLLDGRLALGAKSYGFCRGEPPIFEHAQAGEWGSAWDAVVNYRETTRAATGNREASDGQ